MPVRLYNTLSQTKEVFETRVPGQVSLYVCGPTVYDLSHIGHARCYVAFDVLSRYLEHRGYEVRYVRNITDIDDKIIQRATALGEDPVTLAARFTREYQADMARLGCRPPRDEPRVSDHLPEIVEMIAALIRKAHAYERRGDVYFAVRSFPGYGKLSKRKLDDLRSGARVEVDEHKEDPLDFALWKSAKPGEPAWDSPWGKGRPGWHIECSAMSLRYLTEGLDIHGGGMDLVFPHHENEIAQSECARDFPFARYWLHNGFVNVDKEKMSKSLGNFFTVRQVLEHVEPEALRYYLLGTHYRAPISFDVALDDEGKLLGFPGLEDAERRLAYCYTTLERVRAKLAEPVSAPASGPGPFEEEIEGFGGRFEAAMDDDVNTAAALGHLAEILKVANDLTDRQGKKAAVARSGLERVHRSFEVVGRVLGLFSDVPAAFHARRAARVLARRGIDPSTIDRRVAERSAARAAREFARADELRAALAQDGIELQDSPNGTTWRVA